MGCVMAGAPGRADQRRPGQFVAGQQRASGVLKRDEVQEEMHGRGSLADFLGESLSVPKHILQREAKGRAQGASSSG